MGLSDEVHAKITALSDQGNAASENGDTAGAIRCWEQALRLVPQPRTDHEAAAWLLGSIGDARFEAGQLEPARAALSEAMACGGAGNPFLHLRLGQTLFELGDQDRAADELMRAYALEGEELFADEDPKYLAFLGTRADLSTKAKPQKPKRGAPRSLPAPEARPAPPKGFVIGALALIAVVIGVVAWVTFKKDPKPAVDPAAKQAKKEKAAAKKEASNAVQLGKHQAKRAADAVEIAMGLVSAGRSRLGKTQWPGLEQTLTYRVAYVEGVAELTKDRLTFTPAGFDPSWTAEPSPDLVEQATVAGVTLKLQGTIHLQTATESARKPWKLEEGVEVEVPAGKFTGVHYADPAPQAVNEVWFGDDVPGPWRAVVRSENGTCRVELVRIAGGK